MKTMKRTAALFLSLLMLCQLLPVAAPAEGTAEYHAPSAVYTVIFGEETYLVPEGYTIDPLPDPPAREGKIFTGWYDGEKKAEAPFTPTADAVFTPMYESVLSVQAEDGALITLSGSFPEGYEYLSVVEEGLEKSVAEPLRKIKSNTKSMTKTMAAPDLSPVSLYTYDLTLTNADGREYQPEDGPLTITVQGQKFEDALAEGRSIEISQTLAESGDQQIISDPAVSGKTVSFQVDQLSKLTFTGIYDLDEAWESGSLTDGDVNVSLAGTMPRGAEAKAEKVDPETKITEEETKEKETVAVLAAAEITLLNADVQAEPFRWGGTVHVTMSSDKLSKALEKKAKITVYHIDSEGNQTPLTDDDININEDEHTVSFEADASYVYAVAEIVIEKTVLASDGHNYNITVTCEAESGIPEDADLLVEEILSTSSEYMNYVKKTESTLGWETGSASYARVFDISIVKNGVKLQPASGTTVDVRIELADAGNNNTLSVVHFEDNKAAGDKVPIVTNGQALSFEASGFSIYVVTDQTKRLIYEFYKDGNVIASQYVKDEETLVDPGVESDYGQTFIGWYIGDEIPANLNENDLILNIDGLNADLVARKQAGFEDGDIVKVHAVFREAWYLRYMYQDTNGRITILTTKEVRKDASNKQVTIEDGSEYTTDTFEYWIDVSTGYKYFANSTITLEQHLDLYMKVDGRNWLVFDANAGGPGSGATYTTPQLLVGGDVTQRVADPTRKGYRFIGWNTAPDGNGDDWLVVSYDDEGNPIYSDDRFGSTISEDTVLYAQWEGIPTDYYVVFWRQKVDATGNDPENDYEYVISEKRIGLVGETASLETADTQKNSTDSDYEHYVYNTELSDSEGKEINADGSTVLNVYYDLQTYHLRFFFAREYDAVVGGTTSYEYIPVATTNGNGAITWYSGYNYSNSTQYFYNTNGNRAYYKIGNGGWFSSRSTSSSTSYRINNGTIYIRQEVINGGTTRTYLQVNNNDEGFRYHRTNGLENALKYVYSNDYERIGNTNTWKTIGTTDVSSLISNDFLASNGLSFDPTKDYITVNNVTTWVFTNANGAVPGSSSTVTAKYYYIPIEVRYGQNLTTIWPGASNFGSQTMSNYNYEGRGSPIYPLMWGFFSSGNSQSGAYEKADDGLIYNNATHAYEDYGNFLLYWRFETYSTYAYRVYFSALEGETGGVTVDGVQYIEQPDLNYIATLGTGVNINEIQTLSFNGATVHSRVNSTTATTYNGQNVNGTVSVYYDRNKHDITFVTDKHLANGVTREDHVIADIPYGTNISKYAKDGSAYYTPFDGDESKLQDGYFFSGWYTDPDCTIPYDFTGKTMPDSNITLYAKVETFRTRVVLIPTKNNQHNAEVTFANNQALSFRLDRNEILHSTNIDSENAIRHGYKLDGWYYDEDYQHEYRLDEPVNEHTLGVNMNYQNTSDWNNNTYEDNPDGNGVRHTEVQAILKLYARWVLDIDETEVFVEYEVEDQYLTDNTRIPTDPSSYTIPLDAEDTYEINPNIASAPTDYANGFAFTGWVLLDADGNETEIEFKPGDRATLQKLYLESRTVGEDIGEEGTIRYFKLRAKFHVASEAATSVTFNGNGGVTNDTASKTEVSQAWLVNQDFNILDSASFVREGHNLIGWSFDSETTEEQFKDALARYPSETSADLQALAELGYFKPGEQVAADNLALSSNNNWDPLENTIYAVWEPNRYTVTVKKFTTDGEEDAVFSFNYTYQEAKQTTSSSGTFTLHHNMTWTYNNSTENVPYGTAFSLFEVFSNNGYIVKTVEAKQTSRPDKTSLAETDYLDLEGADGKSYVIKGDTTIIYTNEPIPDIYVKKTVSGNMGDLNKPFNFTITAEKGAENVLFYIKTAADGEATACNGTYNGTRVHGEQYIISAPVGTMLTITEDPEDYTPSIASTTVTTGTVSSDKKTYTVTVAAADDGKTITFTNDKSMTPDTGVRMDTIPYILILALCALGLALRRRRVKGGV